MMVLIKKKKKKKIEWTSNPKVSWDVFFLRQPIKIF